MSSIFYQTHSNIRDTAPIGVSLSCDDADAILVVHDTGVCIPEHELPHLFERFYRMRSTEGRSHEGTGIGLALVKEVVLQHGGNVTVTSVLGQGSRFTVRVPRGCALKRARAAVLQKHVGRLEELTDDLLQVSNLTAGSPRLRPHTVDLPSLVEAVVEQLAEEAQRAKTVVEVRAEAVHGYWDGARVRRVLKVVLSNALKFGAGKPVEIVVDATADSARIIVTDHGIGIARADQARIFKRFERAVSLQYYGGLGIGLWVAHQVMQTLGGTIKVDSGEGATFTLLLPRQSAIGQIP